jgi:hypothetical protein
MGGRRSSRTGRSATRPRVSLSAKSPCSPWRGSTAVPSLRRNRSAGRRVRGGRSPGAVGPQWTDLVAMDASERYRTVLHDPLGEERGRRVDADTASGPLYRMVRERGTRRAQRRGAAGPRGAGPRARQRGLDRPGAAPSDRPTGGAGSRSTGATGARGVPAAQLHRPDASTRRRGRAVRGAAC